MNKHITNGFAKSDTGICFPVKAFSQGNNKTVKPADKKILIIARKMVSPNELDNKLLFPRANGFPHAHFLRSLQGFCSGQVYKIEAGNQKNKNGNRGQRTYISDIAPHGHVKLKVC